MTSYFSPVGKLEGLSLLLLLFIAMPLKYAFGHPEAVQLIGSLHGFLFLAYVALSFLLFQEEKWPLKKLMLALVFSTLPFGTFIFERKYR